MNRPKHHSFIQAGRGKLNRIRRGPFDRDERTGKQPHWAYHLNPEPPLAEPMTAAFDQVRPAGSPPS
ncbi:hypothetical protein CHELA1G11_21200 [Hyphomicrobiales bacterium]|nr:hypothetical protein CHELA1G11_21200 [Hyphomicrobiales bacterium]CAH1693724.1 hypothetical protein CHELA1G2_21507 [Hyphomicrobiales bacterium]